MGQIRSITVFNEQKQTVKSPHNDRVYTTDGYVIDHGRILIFLIIGCIALSCWLARNLYYVVHIPELIDFLIYASICVFASIGFFKALRNVDKSQGVIWINGYEYRPGLIRTHDLIYRVHIQVTKWESSSRFENVITFYRRRITAFGDLIEVDIHCPWAIDSMPNSNSIPLDIVDCKDEYRRAFEAVKSKLRSPDLTGSIKLMEYVGQKHKKERVK